MYVCIYIYAYMYAYTQYGTTRNNMKTAVLLGVVGLGLAVRGLGVQGLEL